jgi:hypothetical protein
MSGLDLEVDILIRQEESNFWVAIPEDPSKWACDLKKGITDCGYVRMRVETLPTGCGGVGIQFRAAEDHVGGDYVQTFGMVIPLEKLKEIIRALEIARDNYLD